LLKIINSKKKLAIFNGKLGQKILVFFVLASFIPLLVGSLLSYYHVQKIIKSDTTKTLQSISKEYGLSLFSHLKLAKDTLVNNANGLLEQNNLSVSQNNVSPYFTAVLIKTDDNKKAVLWGEVDKEIEQHKINELSRIITIKNNNRKQSIYIALKNGIYGKVNSKYLWDASSITDEAELCITTINDGVLFCNSEINNIHLQEINKTVTSSSSRVLKSVNEGVLSTYWPLFMDHEFNIDNWIIIASQNTEISKKRSADFRNIFFLLTLFSLFLVIFLSSVVIRRNLDIINQLIEGTRRILNNNFDDSVNIKSDDEIGELAESFNKMAKGLKNINDEYKSFHEIDKLTLASSDSEVIIKSVFRCLSTIIDFRSAALLNRQKAIKPLNSFYSYSIDRDIATEQLISNGEDTSFHLHTVEFNDEQISYLDKSIKKIIRYDHIKVIALKNIDIKSIGYQASKDETLACIIPISNDADKPVYIAITIDEQIVDNLVKSKLINFSNRVRVAFQALNRESILRHRANHDLLTELPNRSQISDLYNRQISNITKEKNGFALIFIDLDRFKQVNDNHGHIIGDKLLKDFALRIKNILHSDNFLSRLSGDEFIVMTKLIPLDTLPSTVDKLCNCIIQETQQPFNIDNKNLSIGSSIGISLIPEHCHSFEDSLRYADIAMYFSKNNGGNQFTIYEYGMSEELLKQNLLERDLIKAIEKNEIEVHYQVKVKAKDERIAGFESLFRWVHKTYGVISPLTAIEMAEKIGVIDKLGERVFELSIAQWQSWKEKGYDTGTISINISPAQLTKDGFVDFIKETVKCFPLVDYSMIELEVTESIMIEDKKRALKILREIKDLGIKIAIDDFGTGYSSLSYLLDIPATALKIDRSFVIKIEQDKNTLSLLTSIIALGKSMGYEIIAEGVETKQQARFLESCHTDQLQGYLFSKPISAKLVEQRFFDNTAPLKNI